MRFDKAALLTGCGLALMIATAVPADAGPILLTPSSYQSEADSPFAGGVFSYFFLETFEDGLNTTGVSVSGGHLVGSDAYVDSVEGGRDGHSWYSGFTESSFTFTFDGSALGGLPTHVGLVWTDIGWNAATPYYDEVTFEIFDALGVSLGSSGPFLFGDGFDTGQKDEDRFLGAIYSGGISKFRISTNNQDWEVDHLQYGAQSRAVPEPAAVGLLALGVAGVLRARSRRRSI